MAQHVAQYDTETNQADTHCGGVVWWFVLTSAMIALSSIASPSSQAAGPNLSP